MIFEPTLSSNSKKAPCHFTKESDDPDDTKVPWRFSISPIVGQDKHLLLIDREEDRRHVTKTGLELMTDWTIWGACSYHEGLNFAQTRLFHVILINLDSNPLKILPQLLSHPNTQHIPIILTTARLRYSDVQYFSQLGVAGAIAQPYDCVNLGEQIACFLDWQSDRPN
jgi:CheY-like chemotaxis protein